MIATSAYFVPLMFGEGASQKIGEEAKRLGMTKALIICDKGVVGAGIVDPIVKNITDAGVAVAIFDGVLPDPPDTVVMAAVEAARKEKVDGFIAIGGGSSIDTAKAANYCYKYDTTVERVMKERMTQKACPMIAVPTTAGTGSEMTYVSVVTLSGAGVKAGLAGPGGYADLAVVDPLLYVGMPLKPTLACAFDVYTHALDAIVHPKAEVMAMTYGEKALRLVHKYLPRLVKDTKDVEARGGLALAATLGGAAINSCMCHISHAIGHSLGTAYHLPHGACCAVGFADLIDKYYVKWMPERLNIVAEAIGLNLPEGTPAAEVGKKVADRVRSFMQEVGVPTLKEMGADKAKLADAVKMMPKDSAAVYLAYFVKDFVLSEEEYMEVVAANFGD